MSEGGGYWCWGLKWSRSEPCSLVLCLLKTESAAAAERERGRESGREGRERERVCEHSPFNHKLKGKQLLQKELLTLLLQTS